MARSPIASRKKEISSAVQIFLLNYIQAKEKLFSTNCKINVNTSDRFPTGLQAPWVALCSLSLPHGWKCLRYLSPRRIFWNLGSESGSWRKIRSNLNSRSGSCWRILWNLFWEFWSWRRILWNVGLESGSWRKICWNLGSELGSWRKIRWNLGSSSTSRSNCGSKFLQERLLDYKMEVIVNMIKVSKSTRFFFETCLIIWMKRSFSFSSLSSGIPS